MTRTLKKIIADAEAAEMLPVFTIPMRRVGTIMGILFTSSSTQEEPVMTIIDETRRRVADGHKVDLRAFDNNFGTQTFYISDFESLMRNCPNDFSVKLMPASKVDQLRVSYKARNICYEIFDLHADLENPDTANWLRDALIKELKQADTDVTAFSRVADQAEAHAGDNVSMTAFYGIAAILRRGAANIATQQEAASADAASAAL